MKIFVVLATTVIFTIVVIGSNLLQYSQGYAAGQNKGYAAGLQANDTSSCHKAKVQSQWATHVKSDMLKSQHFTQAQANVIANEIAAAYGFPCNEPVVPGNIFDPRATPSPIPLGKPTLPLGNHVMYKKIPELKP